MQGVAPVKHCRFFFRGHQEGGANSVQVITWSGQVFPGELSQTEAGISLKIAGGQGHDGCGLVLMPEIRTGLRFDKTESLDWIDLRQVTTDRAYIYSMPQLGSRTRKYLVKGDVIGVLSQDRQWLKIEFRNSRSKTVGWILAEHAVGLRVPQE